MGTLRFLTLFACVWKDNDRGVSKPSKNSKKKSKRKVNKHQTYTTAETFPFNSLTNKPYNLTIFVLTFNRIKFNLSAIYDREGFWRFYQYQAAWQLPRHWNASFRGAGKARASRIRQLQFNCPTRPSALCNCKKDERLGTRLWSFCIRAKSQIYRGCSSPLSKYQGWVNSPRHIMLQFCILVKLKIKVIDPVWNASRPSLKSRQKIVICKVSPFRNWEKTLSVETLSVSGLPLKHDNFNVPQNTEVL